MKLLIERGADPDDNARWGYPAVMHAAWGKHPAVVHYLLHEMPKQDWPPGYGLGIDVNNAAREGWADVVAKHLALDPLAVHRRGVVGETPLHWAAHNGHTNVCRLLLDAGAEVNADEIGLYGGKPLHWAAEKQANVVRLLLDRGAAVDGRNARAAATYHGFTPLIWCASQSDDSAACAQLLIDAGADVHATDAGGRNGLDWATGRGAPQVAALLSRHGVVPSGIGLPG